MADPSTEELQIFAEQLAGLSGEVARRYFRTPVDVDQKPDASPVTVADREIESILRERIEAAFPAHGILGEEFGTVRGEARYVWVLDPIDGTKAFITGKPLFGTLIGLLEEQKPLLGLIDQPILNERWVGIRGRKTYFNGRPVKTRACPDIGLAAMYSTAPGMFEGKDAETYARLKQRVRYPMFGTDCYGYGLLALGFADLVVEAQLKTHDFFPIVPIVEGAGGRMTDWQGKPLGPNSDGHVLAAGDPALHAAALAILNGHT
ncbi:MAG: histidinol-phosphatase [Alphaproteobacteria bacterium]|nr:histidinol-phosphatase [Alphaproteobacteria bacterium]